MSAEFFSFTEILSLLGLIQSVYVLVYMTFRSGNWRYAIIPMAYFLVLSVAFLLDAAATRWEWRFDDYSLYQWAFWFSGVPLGIMMIFQIARTPELPSLAYAGLLVIVPLSLCFYFPDRGGDGYLVVYVAGLVLGSFSLLAVWIRRDMLSGLLSDTRVGGERFWLIIALIITHVAFLASTFAVVNEWLNATEWMLVRNILGIGFVYIATTSLFRIYPQAIKIIRKAASPDISADNQDVISRLQQLLDRDKVYQEPELGRAQLARELDVGEATLSRIVNFHYGKTIPQLLNDYRVKDAQRLLVDTDAPINNIFAESGFSSVTTFNRVFKDLTGVSPKDYRASKQA